MIVNDVTVFFRWVLRELKWRGISLALLLGVLIRVIVGICYYPAVMLSYDAPRYARVDTALFGDFWMPAGYPMLLRLLHGVSSHLWFTITAQHAMGVITGALLFLAGRRLGLSRVLALIPAAVALLSGDHLYLEHQIMADSALIFWMTVGLAAAVCAFTGTHQKAWLAIASVAMAFAALTRSVALFSIPILMFCCGLYASGSLWRRGRILAAAVLPACAVFGSYVVAWKTSGGEYLGLADMSGWNLYSRVAPFADCKQFTPPPGTEILCESRPPDSRPGPFGYVWDLTSVPRRNFALGPETGAQLGVFARQVILHQPVDYLRAVLVDLLRYVEPWSTSHWQYAGQSPGILSFGWYNADVEKLVVDALAKRYRGTKVRLHGKDALAMYQNVVRVGGLPIVVLLSMSFVGIIKKGQPLLRFGSMLFGLTAFALYVVPVLTVSYDFRYGIPAVTFLVVAGVCGIGSISPKGRDEFDTIVFQRVVSS